MKYPKIQYKAQRIGGIPTVLTNDGGDTWYQKTQHDTMKEAREVVRSHREHEEHLRQQSGME